jgi:formate hydrogenlyase transcriptional activator
MQTVALEYTGLSLDEVQADDFRESRIPSRGCAEASEGRQQGLAGTAPFENEQRVLGKEGRYRWFLITYSPLLGKDGKVVRWYATATDIEDRKRAQEALRNALD